MISMVVFEFNSGFWDEGAGAKTYRVVLLAPPSLQWNCSACLACRIDVRVSLVNSTLSPWKQICHLLLSATCFQEMPSWDGRASCCSLVEAWRAYRMLPSVNRIPCHGFLFIGEMLASL